MKILQVLLLSLLGLVFFSCQKDDETKVKIPVDSLTTTSPLTSLVSRVSQNPTAIDNILDGTSYCSVQLPVTVIIDDNKVVVSSKEDYKWISSIIAEYDTDDDKIKFVYPITMVYRNYSQIVVNNEVQLKKIIDSYEDEKDFHEIDCVDFNYPIVINSYNSDSQIAKSYNIQSNSQFFNFLDNLKATDIIGVVFPIIMTSNINGQIASFTINNSNELYTIIENSLDLCDIPIGSTNLDISNLIINGTWNISNFLDNNEDETAEFSGYNFNFTSNGTVSILKNYNFINGTWSSYIDGGVRKFKISLIGETLDEIEKEWEVVTFNATTIRLKHDTHYMCFTKN